MKHALVPFLGLVLFGMAAEAQNADVSAQLGYPPTILYNGKIVTVPEDRIPNNPRADGRRGWRGGSPHFPIRERGRHACGRRYRLERADSRRLG